MNKSDGQQPTLDVTGEGTWTVDATGEVTFTPDTGFTGDPTPITYTVEDGEGNVSIQATIAVGYTTLAVNLSYVRAEQQSERVNITWETATETGNAGFNVYAEVDGVLQVVNPQLIPSTMIDSVSPVQYNIVSEMTVERFYIDMVSISGQTQRHGPLDVGEAYGTPSGSHNSGEAKSEPVIWLPMINFSRLP